MNDEQSVKKTPVGRLFASFFLCRAFPPQLRRRTGLGDERVKLLIGVGERADAVDEAVRHRLLTVEDAADVGSILYGEEAVADGLIDRVGTLADAYEELYALIAEARAATKLRRKRAAQEK